MTEGSTVVGMSRLSTPRLSTLACGLLVAFAWGATATATPAKSAHPERAPQIEDFWLPSPSERSREARLSAALDQLRRSLDPMSPRTVILQPALFRHALESLRRLALTLPQRADYWYWYGHAAQLAQDEEATRDAWSRVWALDPDHWSGPDTAFTLGVLLAKTGRFAESLRIYQLGMPRATRLSTRGIMASNAGESAMALGQLALAERLYRESLLNRPDRNSAALWGLMVALDRQGHSFASQDAATKALLVDPNLDGLVGPDVFFVPNGDVHYYLALAHQAAGRVRDAIKHWEEFGKQLPSSPHLPRAQQHLAVLRAQMAQFRPRVWVGRVLPPEAAPVLPPLLAQVERCYLHRAKGPALPEGPLPVMLLVAADRIRAVEKGWAPGALEDGPLWQCVTRALRGRRLSHGGHNRIMVTFQLERAP